MWSVVYSTYNIPPQTNITNMFGNWLSGIDKLTKGRIHIGVAAICWSIWNCTNNIVFNKKIILCRLSIWRPTGFGPGLTYSRQISGSLWLLDVHGSWWSLRISSAGFRGSILIALRISSCYMLIMYRWLIFVSTLCDPWFIRIDNYWYFAINDCIHHFIQAEIPISKRKKEKSLSRMMESLFLILFWMESSSTVVFHEPAARAYDTCGDKLLQDDNDRLAPPSCAELGS